MPTRIGDFKNLKNISFKFIKVLIRHYTKYGKFEKESSLNVGQAAGSFFEASKYHFTQKSNF